MLGSERHRTERTRGTRGVTVMRSRTGGASGSARDAASPAAVSLARSDDERKSFMKTQYKVDRRAASGRASTPISFGFSVGRA